MTPKVESAKMTQRTVDRIHVSASSSDNRRGSASRPRRLHLFATRVLDIWKYLRTQPLSFWLICFFMFLEYVRPQSVWESLGFLPWSSLTLAACVIACILERRRFRLTNAADATLLIFTAVLLVSCVFAYNTSIAVSNLWSYLSWVLIYLLIVNLITTEKRFFIFVLAFLLYNTKMSQNAVRSWADVGFGWSDWGATGAPGWFQNSGEFGIEMTIFLPMSLLFWLALKPHWRKAKLKYAFFLALPISAVIGIIASSSRGAVLGGAAVGLVLLLQSRYKIRAAVVAGLATFIILAIMPPEQMDRFRSMGEDDTSVKRTTLWKNGIKITNDHPVFGVGFRNWMLYYRNHIYDDAAQLPHNIFIEASAELGYPGLGAFGAMIVATFVVNRRTRRLSKRLPNGLFMHHMSRGLDGALVGFLVSGFFVTVLYYPFFWINLAMTSALHRSVTTELRARGISTAVAPDWARTRRPRRIREASLPA